MEFLKFIVFLDFRSVLRFIRRLKRDLSENGRSFESVTKQYLSTIRPMHDKYVEPSKIHADLNIPEGWSNRQAVDLLISHLHALQEKDSS